MPRPDEVEPRALQGTSIARVPALPLAVSGLVPPAHGSITAAHDQPIQTFAATDDGAVAVSVDTRGGMRLWPSLDGKHEPVVVRNEAVIEALAIARDGDDVVIAAAGPLGQIELIRTSHLGEPIAHTRIDLARTIVALHATPSGFVALRDDQVLVALDLRGASRKSLVANPGERIAAIAARRGKLLAFVQIEGRVHARWIDLGDQLAWGGQSPALAIEPTTAVLAPDLKRIAATSEDHRAIAIVDLESGRKLVRPLVDDADVARRPLGFIDDQHLQAQVSHGASKWWDGRIWSVKRLHVHSGTVVATDRAVVTADGGGLTLITPTTAQHLGYGLTDLSAAQVDGDRVTICNTHSALQVDDRFRTRWKFAPIESSFYELTLLDGRHAVVHDSSALSVVDLAHPERLTPVASPLGETSYEPATHLLAVVDRNGGAWFGHYSPTAHTFDKTTPISGIRSVALLDPAVNHGSIAVVIAKDEHEITNEAERETVSEIRGINFAATSPLRAARSYQRPVFLEMYWDPQPDPNPDPAVVLGLTHMKHRPSRDGSLIAEVGSQLEEFGPRQITLRDRAGTVVWSATRRGVTDVVWLPSGELVAFGSGIAKIDVATGALLDRQCGWEFGLWDDDGGPGTGFGAALCEAP